MEVKYEDLDERYVKKDELHENVLEIVKQEYVRKDDFTNVVTEITAVSFELKENTKILRQIYSTSAETQNLQIHQKAELDRIAKELDKAQKNLLNQVWTSLPFIVRSIITFLLIFIFLITASMMIGEDADLFMRNNGLFVTLFSGVVSIFIAKNGGDKK